MNCLNLYVLLITVCLTKAALDPAKLLAAYFTSASFDGKEDSLYLDQSGNGRTIDVGRITHFNDRIDFVNFGASNTDGVAVRAFERFEWGEDFGISLWYRRTSGMLTKQGLIGNTNDADTGSYGIFTEGYATVDAGTIGFEVITDQNQNRQWRQEFAGLYSREGQWHHLVLTVNGDFLNFYLDNKVVKFDGEEYNQPATGKLWVEGHPLQIGGKLNGGEAFRGDLRDIYLYDQFLTADDVNLLFGGPTAAPTEAPSHAPAQPTPGPTPGPTPSPSTASPTSSPTAEASNPTMAPTVEWVPTPYPTQAPMGTIFPTSADRGFTARPTVKTLSVSDSSTDNKGDTMSIIIACLASALGLMCLAGIYSCKDHIYTVYSEWDDIEVNSSTINPFETWMQHHEKRNSLNNATGTPTVTEDALPDTMELGAYDIYATQGDANVNPMLAMVPPGSGGSTDGNDAMVDYVVASTDRQSLGTAIEGVVSPLYAVEEGAGSGSSDDTSTNASPSSKRRSSSVYVPPAARAAPPPRPPPVGGDSSALMKSILNTNKSSANALSRKRGTLVTRRQMNAGTGNDNDPNPNPSRISSSSSKEPTADPRAGGDKDGTDLGSADDVNGTGESMSVSTEDVVPTISVVEEGDEGEGEEDI